ncbi:MAG: V-type ATP synthase subunit F [Sedimenticolaceae bacterium]|nr:V-type ATP synthase subunit F [Sedimenticolaceae bacterium]
MQQAAGELHKARLIAMGDEALVQGFALIGFETWPDADAGELDELLGELMQMRQQALVLLQSRLMRSGMPNLQRVLDEGGRVVIAEIPSLEQADGFRPSVEEMLHAVLPGQIA